MNLNKQVLRDKIYACWLGKNIGGTMGGPYEGTQELLHVEGFSTPPGVVLPNDDLDLQLVWLKALEEKSPWGVDANVLGEYWMNFVSPNWNEYGIGKSNMAAGFLPPLSGEMDNHWKNSNGAWIRSEIWACITPGNPDKAITYAIEDACVDHGMGEGTYGEMFTAALESAAFLTDDFNLLIQSALARIPQDCRVAKSVNMVIDACREGLTWVEAREKVLEDSLKDLGWFQAPANIAFVVIGLLYGENDFKKSMLIALNCADDTDCTCATLGSIFGIAYGTKCIPEKWKEHIGETINTVAVNVGEYIFMPGNISDLTDRVLKLALKLIDPKPVSSFIPVQNRSMSDDINISDDETDIPGDIQNYLMNSKTAAALWTRKPYSYEISFVHSKCEVSYKEAPVIKAGGQLSVCLSLTNLMSEPSDPRRFEVKWLLPEGFKIHGPLDIYMTGLGSSGGGTGAAEYIIEAPENVEPLNELYAVLTWKGRPTKGIVPVTLRGYL